MNRWESWFIRKKLRFVLNAAVCLNGAAENSENFMAAPISPSAVLPGMFKGKAVEYLTLSGIGSID